MLGMDIQMVVARAAQELCAGEIECIEHAVREHGRAVLLVSGEGQRRLLRPQLARTGVGLGVAVLTSAEWLDEAWGVFGNGRAVVRAEERQLLMAQELFAVDAAELAPLAPNAGTARLLGTMARDLAPYAAEALEGDPGRLTAAEKSALRMVARYREALEHHGRIERSEAAALLARQNGALGAVPVFVRGIAEFPAYLVEALGAAARSKRVTFMFNYQSQQLAASISTALDVPALEPRIVGEAQEEPRENEPCALRVGVEKLYNERLACAPGARAEEGPGRLEVPGLCMGAVAGPTARGSAYASAVARMSAEGRSVVVVAPRPGEALVELAPRLAGKGVRATAALSRPFGQTAAGEQYFALIGLAERMRESGMGSWWPAPELSDWLLSPFSGVRRSVARAFDKKIRSRRSMTAELVCRELQGLQSRERNACAETGRDPESVVCFEVFDAIMRGKYGSALNALLRAAQLLPAGALSHVGAASVSFERLGLERAARFLQETARRLGVAPAPALQVLAAQQIMLEIGIAPGGRSSAGSVRFMSLAHAAALAPDSAEALAMLDLDAESYPLRPAEGAAVALAEELGCPAVTLDPAAAMRERMAAVLRVPSREAVMLYVAHDGAADERFCAAALSELLTVCAPSDVSERFCAEDALVANFDPLGGAGSARITASGGGEQALSDQALPHLVLKARDAHGALVPRRFSASQIEAYLACPYQWFLSSRVRPQEVDAAFGGLEKGNFVHDVMQRFHEEIADEEPGRVTPENLDQMLPRARAVFDAVRAEHAAAKTRSSAPLIAQTEAERLEIDAIWRQIRAALVFETKLLPPFRPVYAEFSFDKLGVTYAGVPLGGRIDRIDVTPDGRAVVIDYKHRGSLAEFKLSDPTEKLEGEALDPLWLPTHVQTLIYAQAVRRALGLEVVGAVYFGTRKAEVAGAVSDALAESGMAPGIRSGFPGAKGGCLSFPELLDHVEGAVAVRLQALARGAIAASDEARSCRFCPAVGCEKRKG